MSACISHHWDNLVLPGRAPAGPGEVFAAGKSKGAFKAEITGLGRSWKGNRELPPRVVSLQELLNGAQLFPSLLKAPPGSRWHTGRFNGRSQQL